MRSPKRVRNCETNFTNIATLTFVGALLCGWFVAGCASYRPQPLPEESLLERAKSQSDSGLRVSVAVLGEEQNKAMFGVSLAKAGIQPIWILIENDDTVPYILFPHNVDHNAFSP